MSGMNSVKNDSVKSMRLLRLLINEIYVKINDEKKSTETEIDNYNKAIEDLNKEIKELTTQLENQNNILGKNVNTVLGAIDFTRLKNILDTHKIAITDAEREKINTQLQIIENKKTRTLLSYMFKNKKQLAKKAIVGILQPAVTKAAKSTTADINNKTTTLNEKSEEMKKLSNPALSSKAVTRVTKPDTYERQISGAITSKEYETALNLCVAMLLENKIIEDKNKANEILLVQELALTALKAAEENKATTPLMINKQTNAINAINEFIKTLGFNEKQIADLKTKGVTMPIELTQSQLILIDLVNKLESNTNSISAQPEGEVKNDLSGKEKRILAKSSIEKLVDHISKGEYITAIQLCTQILVANKQLTFDENGITQNAAQIPLIRHLVLALIEQKHAKLIKEDKTSSLESTAMVSLSTLFDVLALNSNQIIQC